MPTVAEQLRTTREGRNLTVHQVGEITKIRTDHIRALEAGDFDVFTAPVYIKGFTRTYAALLKLDVPAVMAQLDAELAQTEKFSEPPNLTPHPQTALDFLMLQLSQLDWRKTVWVIAVLGVVGGIVGGWLTWRHYRDRDPLADLPPAVYQPADGSTAETLPLDPSR